MPNIKRPPTTGEHIETRACKYCKTKRGVELVWLKALGAKMLIGYLVHCELCEQEGPEHRIQQEAIDAWNIQQGENDVSNSEKRQVFMQDLQHSSEVD